MNIRRCKKGWGMGCVIECIIVVHKPGEKYTLLFTYRIKTRL